MNSYHTNSAIDCDTHATTRDVNWVGGIHCFHSIHILQPEQKHTNTLTRLHTHTHKIVCAKVTLCCFLSRKHCYFFPSFSLSLIWLLHNGLSIWLKILIASRRFWDLKILRHTERNHYALVEEEKNWIKYDIISNEHAWNLKS